MARIPEEHRTVALDLVYNRRTDTYDPLQKLMELFEGVSAASARESRRRNWLLPLFERLSDASSTASVTARGRPR